MPAYPIAPSLSGVDPVPHPAQLPTAPSSSKNMVGKSSKTSSVSSGRKSAPTLADIVVDPITQTASDYWAPGAEVTSVSNFSQLSTQLIKPKLLSETWPPRTYELYRERERALTMRNLSAQFSMTSF